MEWHSCGRFLLVALLAVLHGLAPLLHVHLGGDHSPARGVHLHLSLAASHDAPAVVNAHDLTQGETPAIGVGSEIRRDSGWQDGEAAPAPNPMVRPPAARGTTPCAAGTPCLRAPLAALRPPAQAPPPHRA